MTKLTQEFAKGIDGTALITSYPEGWVSSETVIRPVLQIPPPPRV